MPLIKPPTSSGALIDGTFIEWSIHLRDAHHARLRQLAQSINDTARRARIMLSLVLILAFYLDYVMFSVTDKGFLLHDSIGRQQVNIDFSIVGSYIVVPIIFL